MIIKQPSFPAYRITIGLYDPNIMKIISFGLAILVCLSGCAKINDAGMGLLSSSSPAVAVVNESVLAGKVTVFTDRSGRINLETKQDPALRCMGNLRYTATRSGVANLKCSDGTDVSMSFNAIGETKGFGSGKTSRGQASFAFGFNPAESASYLNLPAGKRLVSDGVGNFKLDSATK